MPAPPPKVSGEYFGHRMTLDISMSICIIGTSMNTVDKVWREHMKFILVTQKDRGWHPILGSVCTVHGLIIVIIISHLTLKNCQSHTCLMSVGIVYLCSLYIATLPSTRSHLLIITTPCILPFDSLLLCKLWSHLWTFIVTTIEHQVNIYQPLQFYIIIKQCVTVAISANWTYQWGFYHTSDQVWTGEDNDCLWWLRLCYNIQS